MRRERRIVRIPVAARPGPLLPRSGARLITSGEEQMAAMSSDLEQRRPTTTAALA